MDLDWEVYKKKLLKKPGFKKALKDTELEYQVARTVIKSRIDKGLTQKEMAKKMNTTQSVISRVENAKTLPTLSFLKRLADTLHLPLRIQFG